MRRTGPTDVDSCTRVDADRVASQTDFALAVERLSKKPHPKHDRGKRKLARTSYEVNASEGCGDPGHVPEQQRHWRQQQQQQRKKQQHLCSSSFRPTLMVHDSSQHIEGWRCTYTWHGRASKAARKISPCDACLLRSCECRQQSCRRRSDSDDGLPISLCSPTESPLRPTKSTIYDQGTRPLRKRG